MMRVKLPEATPANDNGRVVSVVPVFLCLRARHDLTLLDVFVYGALLMLDESGARLNRKQIASTLGLHERHLIARVAKLEAAGLVRRVLPGGRGRMQRYELLGPRCQRAA